MTKYLTLALRKWNLAQPAWKPFLRLDQLDLGALLWVVWRSRELEGERGMLVNEDHHICTEATCPRGTYYVTAVNGHSFWRMAGPYDTHQEAIANVARALNIANKYDGACMVHGVGHHQRQGKQSRTWKPEQGRVAQSGLPVVV